MALLTCRELPVLYREEQELPAALARAGVDAVPVVWSDGLAALEGFDLAVFRSTWDYFTSERAQEFADWMASLARTDLPVLNPLSLVKWNLDKAYLMELEQRGVRIVPTRHFKGGPDLSIGGLMDEMGWSRAVIKPTVSGGAYRTYLVDRETAAAHDAEANALRQGSGLLVQPYFSEIETEGEWSFVFFENTFSHALIKKPATGEFRVQPQYGGGVIPVAPSPRLLAAAQGVLDALPEPAHYARIDGVVRGGELYLMEVEVIEPYLYLASATGAAQRFVDGIVRAAHRFKASALTPRAI